MGGGWEILFFLFNTLCYLKEEPKKPVKLVEQLSAKIQKESDFLGHPFQNGRFFKCHIALCFILVNIH